MEHADFPVVGATVEGPPVKSPQDDPTKCTHFNKGHSWNEGEQICGPDAARKKWKCPMLHYEALHEFDRCGRGPLTCDKQDAEETPFMVYDFECGPVEGSCVLTNARVIYLSTDKCKVEGNHREHPPPPKIRRGRFDQPAPPQGPQP